MRSDPLKNPEIFPSNSIHLMRESGKTGAEPLVTEEAGAPVFLSVALSLSLYVSLALSLSLGFFGAEGFGRLGFESSDTGHRAGCTCSCLQTFDEVCKTVWDPRWSEPRSQELAALKPQLRFGLWLFGFRDFEVSAGLGFRGAREIWNATC